MTNIDYKEQKKSWFKKMFFVFDVRFFEKHFSYILFLTFFVLLYIFNGHNAIRLARKINKLDKELDTLKYKYLIYKSQLADMTQQSTLIEEMSKIGLKPLKKEPIILNDTFFIKSHND